MKQNARLRLLYVMELLVNHTNETKGVTMQQIIEWVNEKGLTCERKSIYEDLKALNEYGIPIEYFRADKTYRMM